MRYIEIKNINEKTIKTLLKKNEFSKRAIDRLLKDGILLNDKEIKSNLKIEKNDLIKIPIDEENLDYEPIKGKINIKYEDENLLIISKDSNITVNSNGQVNLANYIAYYFKENHIKAKVRFINRLDMNTSGLIMIAKNSYAQSFYQKEIEDNGITKKYLAYVEGKLNIDKLYKIKLTYDENSKRYDQAEDGKLAITYFKSLETNEKYSIIECDIKTGKTHQIRSSLRYLGHPIIGDKLYGSTYDHNRFLLHSYYLKFNVFFKKESITIKDYPEFEGFVEKIWKYFSCKKIENIL